MVKNYFQTWELIPWELYLMVGENGRNLVDNGIVEDANKLRAWSGKQLICNTRGPGGRNQCGLRLPGSAYYKEGSQHSGNRKGTNRCTALDLIPRSSLVNMLIEILQNPDKYPHIKFIEIDISWLHIDNRIPTRTGVWCWSPTRGTVTAADYLEELYVIRDAQVDMVHKYPTVDQ